MAEKSYNKLFPDILKIGMEYINTGISYEEMKRELERKGYKFGDEPNSCKESTIQNWFADNFSECVCLFPKEQETDQKLLLDEYFRKHSQCKFIIEGKACLTYLNHKDTRRSKIYCLLAFIGAAAALIFAILCHFLL
jgi:hypothetical protein